MPEPVKTTMFAIGIATGVLRAPGDTSPRPALRALLRLDVPAQESIRRLRDSNTIMAEARLLEEARGQTAEKYATNGDDGKPIPITPAHPKWKDFTKEVDGILASEVPLSITPITEDRLGEGSISPEHIEQLKALGWVVSTEGKTQ